VNKIHIFITIHDITLTLNNDTDSAHYIKFYFW